MSEKRAAFYALGCKVNQEELGSLKTLFRSAGYRIVDFREPADVYVIHTCTVTHLSDAKSRQAIRRAVRQNPDGVVAVTGCYAQVSPDEVFAIPGVDVVVGTQQRSKLVALVEQVARTREPVNFVQPLGTRPEFEELPAGEGSRVRAFLKIQEGCRQFCSYCIVPMARGHLRSRGLESALQEVERLVASGYREVVLTGVHLGSYGLDLPGDVHLADLIKELVQVDGLIRLRVSSLDPNEFTPALVDVLTSSPVVCPHLHIPLQSGDDQVLRRMRRRYDVGEYRRVVEHLRSRQPDLNITTDIIVGFPGETEEQFANTVALAREVGFGGIHVFKYSPRAGTPAAGFPDQVPHGVKERRSKELIELAGHLAESYANRYLKRVMDVLVEQPAGDMAGYWEGHTANYLRVVFPSAHDCKGQLVPVVLEEVKGGQVLGTPVRSKS